MLSSDGVFQVTDVSRDMDVSSRGDRKNISKILARLVDEGLIERAVTDGVFSVTECNRDLELVSCSDKTNYRRILRIRRDRLASCTLTLLTPSPAFPCRKSYSPALSFQGEGTKG